LPQTLGGLPGIIPVGTLTVNAISGYSGGGKALMNLFETGFEPWGTLRIESRTQARSRNVKGMFIVLSICHSHESKASNFGTQPANTTYFP
jgi:hypothetical protein